MTRSLAWYWEAGGWSMYPLTLLLLLGAALALVALIFAVADRSSRALRPLALALAALSLMAVLLGAVARSRTISAAEESLLQVNPADRATLLEAAHDEAQIPLRYALLIGAPLGAVAAAVGLLRRRGPAASRRG